MLRPTLLSSLTLLASVALTACGSAVIEDAGGASTSTSTGTGGAGGASTSTSSGTGGTGAGGATNMCATAGGTCVPVVPDACMYGTWDNAYACGTGVGVACCLPLPTSGDSCATEGAVRCIAGAVETCSCINAPGGACTTIWVVTTDCAPGAGCNSDGTACVTPTSACSVSTDCGCGCGCINGACECMGALPPTCVADSDCGPSCSGFHCVDGGCEAPACHPGADQTCNENIEQSSYAGHCNADATCTCNAGYAKKPSGKCG